jgi:hypothetical protein
MNNLPRKAPAISLGGIEHARRFSSFISDFLLISAYKLQYNNKALLLHPKVRAPAALRFWKTQYRSRYLLLDIFYYLQSKGFENKTIALVWS